MATAKIIVFDAEKCKGCMECEIACSKVLNKNEEGGEYSAIRIHEGKEGYVMTNCNMCGLCIDMCPVLALKRIKVGTVTLDKKACIGCQSCVGFCPRGVMRRAPDSVTPFKCIACGKCVEACPENALELKEVDLDEFEETVYSYLGVCE